MSHESEEECVIDRYDNFGGSFDPADRVYGYEI